MKNRIHLFHPFIYSITAVLFLYFLVFVINPELIYHLHQPHFFTSLDFFRSFQGYPGGTAGYISGFLMQFYMAPWAGGIIILSVGAGISLIFTALLKRIAGSCPFALIIHAIVLTFILFLKGTYLFNLSPLLSILMALSAAYIYTRSQITRYNYLLPFFLSLIVYFTAGGMALMLFSTISILYLLLNKTVAQRHISIPVIFLTAVLLPGISYKFLYPIALDRAYFYILPEAPTVLIFRKTEWLYALLAFFPVSLLLVAAMVRLKNTFTKKTENKPKAKTKAKAKAGKSFILKDNPWYSIIAQSLIIIVLVIAVARHGVDKSKKMNTLADYHTYRMEWDKVLEVINDYHEYDFMLNSYFNLAHLMKGTLSEKLLYYPQLMGADGLLMDEKKARYLAMFTNDIFYHLGYISVSQVYAGEVQTLIPNSPRILKRLILNHIIQGNYQAAQTYLNALEKNILYRDWVKKYKTCLTDENNHCYDDDILAKRDLMPQGWLVEESSEGKLRSLLAKNEDNTRARDLLMAYYLLDHNLARFARMLSRQVGAGETNISTLYYEALAVYSVMGGEMDDNLNSVVIPPAIWERLKNFSTIASKYLNDTEKAKAVLSKDYSNTYWYYFRYNSPKVTGASIKQRNAI